MTGLESLLLSLGSGVLSGAVGWYVRQRAIPEAVKAEPIAFVRQWKPLTPAQIAQAFQGWNETDGRWRAQWDLLSNELEGALSDIAQTKATPEELARWAGRVEMLMHWRAQLLALRRKAGEE